MSIANGHTPPIESPAFAWTDPTAGKTVSLRDGRTVTLRRPTLDDARAMIDYLDRVRRSSPHILISPEDPLPTIEQEHGFIRGHSGSDALMLIAAPGDPTVVAVSSVQRGGRAKIAHRAELGISVAQAWRGSGLGRALMNELIGFCRGHPAIHKVSLSAYADNPVAISLYESCGFVHEGRRVRHIRQLDGTFCDELVMGLWVK